MYAEERQQAMAQLDRPAGPAVRRRARRARSTSPPRPCAATCPRWSVSASSAACTGAPCPPARSPSSSPGSASATRPTPPRRTRSPPPPSPCSRRPGSTVLIDAGSTTARLAAVLPRDHRLTRRHPRRARSPPGSPGSPQIELHLLPGRVRPTTQAAVGADTVAALGELRADVAFLGTNGISVEPRAHHPRPRRGRHQAGHGRLRAPASSCWPTPPRSASRPRCGSPRSSDVDVLVTDAGISDRRPHAPSSRPAWRSWSHDRHPHRQPQPRPHGRARRAARTRGAVQRADVGHLAGRRQGRQHLPRRRSRPASRRSPCSRPRKDDPFVLELLAAGIDCRPVDHAGRPARQHHDQRARRHHHQAQQPRPGDDRRRPAPRSTEALRRRADEGRLGGARRLAAARAPPPSGTPTSWPRCAAPAPGSPSTPATRRCAPSSTRLDGRRART